MFNQKRAFSLILAIVMVLGSMTAFAEAKEKQEKIQWIEEPSLGEVKNKKVEVHGKLEIPQGYKGPNIVKLTVDGFNVVPKNDGSFSETIFTGFEVEVQVRVFVGKNEIPELARSVYYFDDTSRVYEVMAMINTLPELDDLNIRDKDAVIKARLAYDKLSDFEKKIVDNLNKLIAAEIKIAELEEELDDNYFFPNILMPFPKTDYYDYSQMKFEGYVTNMKYLDKVLVDEQEAEIEYIKDAMVRDLDGSILYRGPAYRFEKTLVLEDGAQVIKVEAISQSGKSGGWARRFWIDTTPPELDIVVKDRDIASDKAEIEINMRDNFGYMELYLFDSFDYLHDKGHSYNYPSEATTTVFVDLETGKNEFVFTLKDIVGNETVKTITIHREEYAKPYVEAVTHDVNHNGNFYRLYNYKNLPEANRWGHFYKLRFKFKDGTEYLTVGNPVRISTIYIYNHKEAEEIEDFDVIIYESGGQFGPYTEILTIEDVPFAGPNHERRAIFAAATAVGKAEKAKNAGNVEDAQIYLDEARPVVNALPDGSDKDGLLDRIQRVQDWIDEQLVEP